MSLTFKITIPDGELCEHLQGRDSKSRNFELQRLATNELFRTNGNTHYAEIEQAKEIKTDSTVTKSANKVDSSSAELERDVNLEPAGANIDFSDDILSMGGQKTYNFE